MRYLITAACLAGLMATTAWAEPTVEQLQKRVEQLEAENAELRAKLRQARAKVESLTAKAERSERKAEAAEAELERTTETLEQREREREAEAEQRRQRYVEREEDEASGATVLKSRPVQLEPVRGTRSEHFVQFIAPAGKAPAADEPVTMKLAAFGSGRNYNHLDSITLLIDGEASKLPIVEYDRERRVTGSRKTRVDRSNEFLRLRASMALMQRLADADRVVVDAGPARLKGPRALREACRAMIEAMSGVEDEK